MATVDNDAVSDLNQPITSAETTPTTGTSSTEAADASDLALKENQTHSTPLAVNGDPVEQPQVTESVQEERTTASAETPSDTTHPIEPADNDASDLNSTEQTEDVVHPKDVTADSTTTVGSTASEATTVGENDNNDTLEKQSTKTEDTRKIEQAVESHDFGADVGVRPEENAAASLEAPRSVKDMNEVEPTPVASSAQDLFASPVTKETEAQEATGAISDDFTTELVEAHISSEEQELRGNTQPYQQDESKRNDSDTQSPIATAEMDTTTIPIDTDSKELTQGDDANADTPNAQDIPAAEETTMEPEVKLETEEVGHTNDSKPDDSETQPIEIAKPDYFSDNNIRVVEDGPGHGFSSTNDFPAPDDTHINVQVVAPTPAENGEFDEEMDTPKADVESQLAGQKEPITAAEIEAKAETTDGDNAGASPSVSNATQPDGAEDEPVVEHPPTTDQTMEESQPEPESVAESRVEAPPPVVGEPVDVEASKEDETVSPAAEETTGSPMAHEVVSEEVVEDKPADEQQVSSEVGQSLEEEPVAETESAIAEELAVNAEADGEAPASEPTEPPTNEPHVAEESPRDVVSTDPVPENVTEELHSDVNEQPLVDEQSEVDKKPVEEHSIAEDPTVSEISGPIEENQTIPAPEPVADAPVVEAPENERPTEEEHAADSAPEALEPVSEEVVVVEEQPAPESVEAVEETRAPVVENEEEAAQPATEHDGTEIAVAREVEQPVEETTPETKEEIVAEGDTHATGQTNAAIDSKDAAQDDEPVAVEHAEEKEVLAPVSGIAEEPVTVEEFVPEKPLDERDTSEPTKDVEEPTEKVAEEPVVEAQSIAETTPLNVETVTEEPTADVKPDDVEQTPGVDDNVEGVAAEEKLPTEELSSADSASAPTVEEQPAVKDSLTEEIPLVEQAVEDSLPEETKVIPAEPDIEDTVVNVPSEQLVENAASTEPVIVESTVEASFADTTREDATAVPVPVEDQANVAEESVPQSVEEAKESESAEENPGATVFVEDEPASTQDSTTTRSPEIDITAETLAASESVPKDKDTTEETVAEDVPSPQVGKVEHSTSSDNLTPEVLSEEGSHIERPKSPWTPSFQVTTIGHGVALADESDIPTASIDASEEAIPEPSAVQPVTIVVDGESVPPAPEAEAPTPTEPAEASDTASLSWTPSYSVHSQGSPSPPNMPLEPEISAVETGFPQEEQIPETVIVSQPEASIDEAPAVTETDGGDIKDLDESVPAAEALITEPSAVETAQEEQHNEPVSLVSVPDANQHEATDGATTDSQEQSQEEIAGSPLQIAESGPIHEAQASEPNIAPAVESISESVEENVSLTPPAEEVRPASPSWVPSYTVSKQGSPMPEQTTLPNTIADTSEPPTAGIEEKKDTDPQETAILEPPTLVVNDAKPETTVEEVEHVQERPSTPWTPSYSVTKQGPGIVEEDKIDVIESLSQPTEVKEEEPSGQKELEVSKPVNKESPAFSTTGLIGAGVAGGTVAALAASAVLGGSLSRKDSDNRTSETASTTNGDSAAKHKVFPTVEIPTEENKPIHGSLPSLDENSAVDTTLASPSPETSPVFTRKRAGSTTSSRLFPGGWFSQSSKIPAERTSLEIAKGEFTAARSNPDETILSPLPEPVTPVQERRTSSDRKKWCIIM